MTEEKQKNPLRVESGKKWGKLGGRPKGKTPATVVRIPTTWVKEVDTIVGGPRKRVKWIVEAIKEKLERGNNDVEYPR